MTIYTDEQIEEVIAKLTNGISIEHGRPSPLKTEANMLRSLLTERHARSSVLSTIIERIGSDPTTTITSKEVCALMETRPDSPAGSSGDVPTELDELNLRFVEVCEERDHLNNLLFGHSGVLSSRNNQIGELLAIIHGDGGHYQAEYGLNKAAGDAIPIVHSLMTKVALQPPQPPTKESVEKVCAGCKGKRERFNDVHNRMMTCPHCQGTGKESVRGVSDADVLHACIDYYGVPAWEFMSHKAGCLKNMRAVLESFANRGDGDE